MLILKLNIGKAVRLIDKDKSRDLGEVTRLRPHPNRPGEVLLGFDMLPSIQVLRESLLNGKETENVNSQ